jgi:hypothetical protein
LGALEERCGGVNLRWSALGTYMKWRGVWLYENGQCWCDMLPRFVPGDDALEGWGRARRNRVYEVPTIDRLPTFHPDASQTLWYQDNKKHIAVHDSISRIRDYQACHYGTMRLRGAVAVHPLPATLLHSSNTSSREEQYLSETIGNNVSSFSAPKSTAIPKHLGTREVLQRRQV